MDKKAKSIVALGTALAIGLWVAIAGGAYLVLHTRGSPTQTATNYMDAWQGADYSRMREVSVNVPNGGLAAPLEQVHSDLGVKRARFHLGVVTKQNDNLARAAFTADLTLTGNVDWTYQGSLRLVRQSRHWWVDWDTSAIHPQLTHGDRFHVSGVWPERAAILAADGTRLDSPDTVAKSGSVKLITGDVAAATADDVKRLGAPYQVGDPVGQGGIEQADERRLAGTPASTIKIVDGSKHVVVTLAHFGGKPGAPVQTSIDMHVQLAASHALTTARGTKPIDMVAIQPSTGKVLAVVARPGSLNAMLGEFPPGSTFKVVTASALAMGGMTPADPVQCPGKTTIGGYTIHNFNDEQFGATNLQNAFAVSCNTTFALLANQRLDGSKLTAMATTFGFNQAPALGIPATLGKFTTPQNSTNLAADAFGQGTDLVNPLSQATVAAAIEDGTWRPPQLVTDPAPPQAAQPRQLDQSVLSALRPMMAAVVTQGTAAHVGFPPGVYGKTGTAEYGTGKNPPTHAWFIGYRGDLAFAVIVEGGGTGADSSGPVANAFVRGI